MITTSCSQFSDEKIQANVDRLNREAEAQRRISNTSVEAIEQEVVGQKSVQERYKEAQKNLVRLRALTTEEGR